MAEAIFPDISEELPTQESETIGRSPEFIFNENGRFGEFQLTDGKLNERMGAKAVKQWFELMLRQQPGMIPIYRMQGSIKPGVDRSLLGRKVSPGFIYAEVQRNVEDTATFCPVVRSVDSFEFTRLRHGLEVRFSARLHNGETVEVSSLIESG